MDLRSLPNIKFKHNVQTQGCALRKKRAKIKLFTTTVMSLFLLTLAFAYANQAYTASGSGTSQIPSSGGPQTISIAQLLSLFKQI